jgi:ABC-type transport system involved in multi-copper enzyme maturation permease subunit
MHTDQTAALLDRSADKLRGQTRPGLAGGAPKGKGTFLGPIFAREWLTVPRQSRHYVLRAAYLGLLWVLGLTAWQVTVGWNETATLGDTARFGMLLFQIITLVQLSLLVFFAALTAASTVAREKDRRTFVLLLMTDLRNHEIVLGKLLGSLLQILLLLAGVFPVLALLLLLGGVSPEQVAQACLIMVATALAAGSLGSLVALWREKTFPTLALTVLFLVLYLCLVEALAYLPRLAERLSPGSWFGALPVDTWCTWLDPFRALGSILQPTAAAESLIAPAYGFTAAMLVLSVLLNAWGILRLRVWNPSGEPIMQREQPEDAEAEERDRARAHAAPGAVRGLWANPIVWREIRTRAYGRRPFLVKLAYGIVFALICYYALAPFFPALGGTGGRTAFFAARGLVPIGILSLLLVSAQAVTAITSERDTGALDLLLVTDLTPQEFIFGKLLGILYNVKEFLIPPLLLVGLYGYWQLLATPPRAHPELGPSKNFESLLCINLGALVAFSFVAVLGVHVALRRVNSQLAIINTLGTVFFLSVGTLVCIALILINGRFESQWFSFIFFLAAGVGGLWWVLSADRPSAALTLASWLCPPAVFYAVTNVLVAKPGTEESGDPLMPFLVIAGAFGFAVAAMLVPLLSEFDVALGRTTAAQE